MIEEKTRATKEKPALKLVMLAGGVGGTAADALLHGMDTLKTRMQGQLTTKSTKYTGILPSLRIILAEEGIKGLFGGFTASMLGSIGATTVYFGLYEYIKRSFVDQGFNPTSSYFIAGGIADVGASVFYVPSEVQNINKVVKTRLQLQGRFNNPHSLSAHNYKNTVHAFISIYQNRGLTGLYSGWGATLLRDMPFSAMQFTIYESLKKFFKKGDDKKILSAGQDMMSGAAAGALAGGITTPLDVIKTYLQTQEKKPKTASVFLNTSELDTKVKAVSGHSYSGVGSAFQGIYKESGIRGLYSGAGVRMGWTGAQSMVMFFLYEAMLNYSSRR